MGQLELELAGARPSSGLCRYRFTKDGLVEDRDGRRTVFGLWDRLFGCWTVGGPERSVREVLPRWEFLKDSGVWKENPRRDRPRLELSPFARQRFDRFHAEAAFAAYFSEIPTSYRVLVAPLGHFQWAGLDMIWQVPAFARFLESELHTRGPQYVFAGFSLASVEHMSRALRRSFAEALMSRKRNRLLSELSGSRCSPATVRALAKLGTRPLESWQYKGFLELLADPRLSKPILHRSHLPDDIPWHLFRGPASVLGPEILRVLLGEPDSNKLRSVLTEGRLDSVCDLLQASDHDVAMGARHALRKVRRADDLLAWCERWDSRIVETTRFPPPPFGGYGALHPLDSLASLRREGHDMDNCVAACAAEVLEDGEYFYSWRGPERATVRVVRADDGTWKATEIRSFGNDKVGFRTKALIRSAIEIAQGRRSGCAQADHDSPAGHVALTPADATSELR